MAERFNTTLSNDESPVFSPAGEITLQLKAADAGARVDILARVDAGADWEIVASLDRGANKFVRLPKMPFLKLAVGRNTAGKAISVRDDS